MEVPLTRVVVAATHLEEDDGQEELGRMGRRAGRAVGGVEVGEVESGDGSVDGSGEVVGLQGGFDVAACGVVVLPGRRAEAGPWVVGSASLG
jgi:hypothetical protein